MTAYASERTITGLGCLCDIRACLCETQTPIPVRLVVKVANKSVVRNSAIIDEASSFCLVEKCPISIAVNRIRVNRQDRTADTLWDLFWLLAIFIAFFTDRCCLIVLSCVVILFCGSVIWCNRSDVNVADLETTAEA